MTSKHVEEEDVAMVQSLTGNRFLRKEVVAALVEAKGDADDAIQILLSK